MWGEEGIPPWDITSISAQAESCLLWLNVLLVCRKCEGHDDAVRVLAVAGGKVFSGSYDGTIGVW